MKRHEIEIAVRYMAKPVAFATRGPEGWTLHIHDHDDTREKTLDLTTSRGSLRYFKTLDAAAREAQHLGAWQITITLGNL
jgi:hypothetical protein